MNFVSKIKFASLTAIIFTGKHNEALKSVLQNAPLGSKNQQVKVIMCNYN